MSICSDVQILRSEARKRVTELLLIEQRKLIKLAVHSMSNSELGSYLNQNNELYYYNVENDKPKVNNEKK